jgi:ADP-ribose pyrophosphatase YjhB (NUDIX family)
VYIQSIATSTADIKAPETKAGNLDRKWCLPIGGLLSGETMQAAVVRIAEEELGLVGVDHYTSMRTDWLRYGYSGSIDSSASLGADFCWMSLASVLNGDVVLSNRDTHNILTAAKDGKAALLPVYQPRVGFPYLISACALIHSMTRKVLLVRRGDTKNRSNDATDTSVTPNTSLSTWGIPETHVSRAEDFAFASSRFLRASFGLTLHPTGIIKVEHSGENGLDGARFTLFHFIDEKAIPHDTGFEPSAASPFALTAWKTPQANPLDPPSEPVELCWANLVLVNSMNEAGILRPGTLDVCNTLLTCSHPDRIGGTLFHVQV